MSSSLCKLSLVEMQKGLRNKSYSSVELIKAHIARIEATKELNVFSSTTFAHAEARAIEADKLIVSNTAKPLTGIPIAIKDLYCTKGFVSSSASKILSNFVSPYESTVTQNLFNAGGIMIGKANQDEFAMGSSTTNSYFGATINPLMRENDDSPLTAGGSSGGSAAAVAGYLSPGALGSDTGGSVRQPASYSGIVGVKPSYGRCSRYGIIGFASSLDQAGVFARTVEDSAIILESIMGHDVKDSTSINLPVPNLTNLPRDIKGLKIGIPKEYNVPGMPSEISNLWQEATSRLKSLGAEVYDVSLPHTEYALPTYYILACAEASSNLARYDGVRYGYRTTEQHLSLNEMYERTRSEGFGKEVKRRILLGTYVLSSGYYDAYYTKAQKVRRLISNDFHKVFETVDVILTPTTPSTAFKIGEKEDDPVKMYLNDVFTVPSSLAGLPVISIPSGVGGDGMALGLQVVSKQFAENTLYRAAYMLEEVMEFDLVKLKSRIKL